MKALSLWQPWASLIALGAKVHETRSWQTSYRGELLICASKRSLDSETKTLMASQTFRRALSTGDVHNLPFGASLCLVDLVDCIPTEDFKVLPADAAFGNFEPHRFAWRLENLRVLKSPLPVKGRQGLWNVETNYAELIREALGR